MKKIVIFAVAAATLFSFSSCQKENLENNSTVDGVRIITAKFENDGTKTTLNDGQTPKWAVDDVIRILSETTFEDITLTTDNIENDERTITFNTSLTGTLYAVYPASATTMESCPDGNIAFTIPAKQDGTFASANICVAKSSEDDDINKDNLIFRNATAVLKIKTAADVVGVDVVAGNSIAGSVTASFDGTAVSLTPSSLDKNYVFAVGTSAPSDNVFYLAVAPGSTGSTKVHCYKSDTMGTTDKDSKDLSRNVIYSMDLSSPEWKNTTIAEILPQNFPSASEESQVPPSGAWKTISCSCYLYDGKLIFYNGTTDPPQQYEIEATQTVSLNGDGNFIYTSGNVTVTFSEMVVTKIQFENTDDITWNGYYQESACIAAGTMITMENGELKAVEDLEINDMIRTVDHKTGEVSSAPVCFIWKTENASNAFTLTFEDGVEVTVIEEHGFYDKEERKYAFINADNAKDYIGHHFYNADNGRWLELKSFKLSDESVDAYAIITSKHLNHLSNGMLSMCDGSVKILGLANMFEYDSQLQFDADRKASVIEEFGLTSLEKVLEYKGFTKADYDNYNLQYLNVAIGKGLTSWDYVKAVSDYCEANQIY